MTTEMEKELAIRDKLIAGLEKEISLQEKIIMEQRIPLQYWKNSSPSFMNG